MTTHTLLPFDADAHTVLTHTREAWEALGELLSGAPVGADRLGQATAAYERSLHQLGLHALRVVGERVQDRAGVVLTPRTDAQHRSHFHLDIGRWRRCDRGERPSRDDRR